MISRFVGLVFVLAGCMAGSQAPATSTPQPVTQEATSTGGANTLEQRDEIDIVGLERDARELGGQLETALSTDALDCDGAADLRDRICELSERICAISARHPESPSVGERCTQGQTRCDDARSRVADSCD